MSPLDTKRETKHGLLIWELMDPVKIKKIKQVFHVRDSPFVPTEATSKYWHCKDDPWCKEHHTLIRSRSNVRSVTSQSNLKHAAPRPIQ
jgi:hypothetical protein